MVREAPVTYEALWRDWHPTIERVAAQCLVATPGQLSDVVQELMERFIRRDVLAFYSPEIGSFERFLVGLVMRYSMGMGMRLRGRAQREVLAAEIAEVPVAEETPQRVDEWWAARVEHRLAAAPQRGQRDMPLVWRAAVAQVDAGLDRLDRRALAEACGVTPRSVQTIIGDIRHYLSA